jgi:hypothetical protein
MVLPISITITIALLTVFLCYVVVLKYAIANEFVRTRLMMTGFFFFIVSTLTISFWEYTQATLPYSIATFTLGAVIGYVVGVRAAEARVQSEGLTHYMEHFAHIHWESNLQWWSFINFYSVMGALVLINFVGFELVIARNERFAITASAVGAFLLGTIFPYLAHLWSISAAHQPSKTSKER